MEQLYILYLRKLVATPTDFYRYLYHEIDWSNRLIVILGAKGVGKTTLVLQHIKAAFADPRKALYLSLDHIWFSSHSLLEVAEYHYTHGGTHLFLDEVHKYPNWEQEVKNIYDFYPDFSIVVTGSSMLRLDRGMKADLSRRYVKYDLLGLSFREYINLETKIDLAPLTLEGILQNHTLIAAEICQKVKVLPLFEKYIQFGFYPFYSEGSAFEERLMQVIDSIIGDEIPAISNIEYATTYKIKRFLVAIAQSEPYTLNVSMLSKKLETNRNSIFKMLDLIDEARIVRKLYTKDGFQGMGKPEKILFDNSNILYAFGKERIGTARECFFASQLSKDHELLMPKKGDFLIDDKITVEVGGKGKDFTQIKDLPDSYIAADDIEMGLGSKVPLWMFGLLY